MGLLVQKNKSFTEYLQDNYYGQIKKSLLGFVNENGLRNDAMMKFNYYKKLFMGYANFQCLGYAMYQYWSLDPN